MCQYASHPGAWEARVQLHAWGTPAGIMLLTLILTLAVAVAVVLPVACLACSVRIGFYKAICEVLRVGQCTELVIGLVGGRLVVAGSGEKVSRMCGLEGSTPPMQLSASPPMQNTAACTAVLRHGVCTSLLWHTHADDAPRKCTSPPPPPPPRRSASARAAATCCPAHWPPTAPSSASALPAASWGTNGSW